MSTATGVHGSSHQSGAGMFLKLKVWVPFGTRQEGRHSCPSGPLGALLLFPQGGRLRGGVRAALSIPDLFSVNKTDCGKSCAINYNTN